MKFHLLFTGPLLLSLSVSSYSVTAQNMRLADSLYQLHQYKESARVYFDLLNKSSQDKTNTNILNAAKACSKAKFTDSLYKYLLIIVNRRAIDLYDDIIYEPAFFKHRSDYRWKELSAMIQEQKKSFEAPVAKELIDIYHERLEMDKQDSIIVKYYGNTSLKRHIFFNSLKKADSVNTLKLKSIINTYGLPGPIAIGDNGVKALLFIYQKATLPFQKFYFPFVAEAFKKGNISAYTYATIADRISLFDTGRQIYGTQLRQNSNELFPIENKDSVNFRRLKIGLDPVNGN